MLNQKQPKTIKLCIESDSKNIFLVGLAVKAFCSYVCFDDETSHQIELAVVEAVTNSIEHAYSSKADYEVEVVVVLHSDSLTFHVHDQGRPMKHIEAVRSDFDPNDLETVPERGMGLYIVQEAMDEVTYQTRNGTNILTMRKYL
jgi:serine/threonine-protein kinase RsbW